MIIVIKPGGTARKQLRSFAFAIAAVSTILPGNIGIAGPIPNPTATVQIVAGTDTQLASMVDDSGAVISAWKRDDVIYAQKIDVSGIAQWGENGVVVCPNEVHSAISPILCSDNAGGAIVAWTGRRRSVFNTVGRTDILTQRIDNTGKIMWSDDISVTGLDPVQPSQAGPKIMADEAGGAFLVWGEVSTFNGSGLIYTQRLNGNGERLWGRRGVELRNDFSVYPSSLITDGANGFILISAVNDTSPVPIRGHRVNAEGVSQWPTGVDVATTGAVSLDVTSDGNGGVILTWLTVSNDIFAQQIGNAGLLGWPVDGVPVCLDEGPQSSPKITTDGGGGAIIAWTDNRNAWSNGFTSVDDIFAQRIDTTGTVQWEANGIPVCVAKHPQQVRTIVSDGKDGAVVLWNDAREYYEQVGLGFTSRIDVYGQRLNGSGANLWTDDGLPLCAGAGDQWLLGGFGNGLGESGLVWRDSRESSSGWYYSFVTGDGISPSVTVTSAAGWELYE